MKVQLIFFFLFGCAQLAEVQEEPPDFLLDSKNDKVRSFSRRCDELGGVMINESYGGPNQCSVSGPERTSNLQEKKCKKKRGTWNAGTQKCQP